MSKKIYDSKYTDKKVTASQYIAEKMCERSAAKQGKVLNRSFWGDKEWLKYFRYQQGLANKLLKLYGEDVIIQVISEPRFKNVYSLNLPAITEAAMKIHGSKEIAEEKPEIEEVKVVTRVEKKAKSLFDLI